MCSHQKASLQQLCHVKCHILNNPLYIRTFISIYSLVFLVLRISVYRECSPHTRRPMHRAIKSWLVISTQGTTDKSQPPLLKQSNPNTLSLNSWWTVENSAWGKNMHTQLYLQNCWNLSLYFCRSLLEGKLNLCEIMFGCAYFSFISYMECR